MISCHICDTIGAKAAGWGAALIKRPGSDLAEVGPKPDFVGNDLDQVAD
jgi:2-haloacid dehalogenase